MMSFPSNSIQNIFGSTCKVISDDITESRIEIIDFDQDGFQKNIYRCLRQFHINKSIIKRVPSIDNLLANHILSFTNESNYKIVIMKASAYNQALRALYNAYGSFKKNELNLENAENVVIQQVGYNPVLIQTVSKDNEPIHSFMTNLQTTIS